MDDIGDIGLYDFDIDLSGFDIGIDGFDGVESERYQKPTLERPRLATYDNAIDMAREVDMREGFRAFAFVNGTFIFGDLLEAFSQLGKWEVEKLTIHTLSMSQDNIDSIENIVLMDEPSELRFVLSDYWYSHERHRDGLVWELYRKLDIGDGFRCAFCRTHSKVATVLTKSGNKIVIHGSANLRSSDNIEQVCIENDPELYDFCESFADGILDMYDVVNHNVKRKKSLRSEGWQAAAARAAEAAGKGQRRQNRGKPTPRG